MTTATRPKPFLLRGDSPTRAWEAMYRASDEQFWEYRGIVLAHSEEAAMQAVLHHLYLTNGRCDHGGEFSDVQRDWNWRNDDEASDRDLMEYACDCVWNEADEVFVVDEGWRVRDLSLEQAVSLAMDGF